ncbi:type II toxin-antitoxin system RatA family toxin [Gammaproteobacteria bacterium]|nr:type II toxin-antitoxin system RatA family toxin [Gammaproteobacteria bacterium]
MTIIDQSALLSYSAGQLFDLVNDIEAYPDFMDGCIDAEIISKSAQEVTARLVLGKAGLRYTFTTCNTLSAPERMTMALVEGPFKKFSATWGFKELNHAACKISLKMEFEFSSGLVNAAMKSLFDNTSRNLVNAICQRAQAVCVK